MSAHFRSRLICTRVAHDELRHITNGNVANRHRTDEQFSVRKAGIKTKKPEASSTVK
jgi:hypothetical protein